MSEKLRITHNAYEEMMEGEKRDKTTNVGLQKSTDKDRNDMDFGIRTKTRWLMSCVLVLRLTRLIMLIIAFPYYPWMIVEYRKFLLKISNNLIPTFSKNCTHVHPSEQWAEIRHALDKTHQLVIYYQSTENSSGSIIEMQLMLDTLMVIAIIIFLNGIKKRRVVLMLSYFYVVGVELGLLVYILLQEFAILQQDRSAAITYEGNENIPGSMDHNTYLKHVVVTISGVGLLSAKLFVVCTAVNCYEDVRKENSSILIRVKYKDEDLTVGKNDPVCLYQDTDDRWQIKMLSNDNEWNNHDSMITILVKGGRTSELIEPPSYEAMKKVENECTKNVEGKMAILNL